MALGSGPRGSMAAAAPIGAAPQRLSRAAGEPGVGGWHGAESDGHGRTAHGTSLQQLLQDRELVRLLRMADEGVADGCLGLFEALAINVLWEHGITLEQVRCAHMHAAAHACLHSLSTGLP